MDREAKLALAKKKLQEFQAKKLKPSESVDNFVELYKESESPSPIMMTVADTKTEEDWIDDWVKKVNSIKGKEQAVTSVSLKPVLAALGVSMNVVDTLEFNSSSNVQVSPVKLEEIGLPVIPDVEYNADPVEYQNELLNKITILNEALDKLKKSYLEETSKRKIMENSVAQITSSIVTGLEKVEDEKTRLKVLLEESHGEKNKIKSQMQDLIKKNQELTEEIYLKSQVTLAPNDSDIRLKLEQLTQELFTSKKTCQGLQHTLDVKQAEWIRKEKDYEDSVRSVEMEKASVTVSKANVENMKFSAEEELKKALDLKEEFLELQNKLNEERKELESKTKYLDDAQRILDDRVAKMDQMSQSRDLSIKNQVMEQKEAMDRMRQRLEEEKDEILKDRALLREKEKHFFALEERESSLAIREASILAKETQIADRESEFLKREKMAVEKEEFILRQIKENETNKPSASIEQEMRLRQDDLAKSIKSFNDFKYQLETSMKEREAKYTQKIQNLENEKNDNIKKHAAEKKSMEEKIKNLQDQFILSPTKSNKSFSSFSGTNSDREALEQEKTIISEIKTRTDQESEFVQLEKARILEEANQLEKEWMAVRLKEAEITKAMADISVAAAQQAVGSSISTAETLISRDQMRELEYENRELVRENEDLKNKMANYSGKDKIQPVPISPLFKSPNFKGSQIPDSPVIGEVSADLNQVIFSLTQSNQDLKHRIEYLVKAFEEKNGVSQNLTDLKNEQSRPTSRLNDTYVRKLHKPIADPRMVQSALGNPIAIGYPTSPDLGQFYLRPQIIPSLKYTPPRPVSTDFFRRPDTSHSNYSIPGERRDVVQESPSTDLFKRSETSHSNYSVPVDRKDVVKELDAQISAQINELNQIFGDTSSRSKKTISPTGRGEEYFPPRNKVGGLNDADKERIRLLVKQRIREKKESR